ncbi:MAG: hypothetical protein A3E25_06675 [Burkholderiales bacterium RIFCSPHIGHO2_12_FULL_69_20]|nr:MAG: hypothetical protein A3E25_06675 [Burkholderiales bacterium RIFCSPHIGHO2_12_FULL_69_20]
MEPAVNRVRTVLLALVVVGGLAAATVTDRGAFVMGFFFVFWGGASAAVMWVASRNWTAAQEVDPDLRSATSAENRPYFDENGVHRFQGDVFDVENHPTPGAQGRI